MDFGEILDTWDKQCSQKNYQARKSQSLPRREPAARLDPVTEWIRKNGVYDKDRDIETGQSPGERRRMLLARKPDGVLDLHGLRQDEAWLALENFFRHCRGQGFQKLLIIHGKGNHSEGEAVLKRMVRQFIEKCPAAGESGYGNVKSGGSGSTWVFLKDRAADAGPC